MAKNKPDKMTSQVNGMVYRRGRWRRANIKIKHPKPLPCPFCSNETDFYIGHESAFAFHVHCEKCGARTRPIEFPKYRTSKVCMEEKLVLKAIAAWNKRTKTNVGTKNSKS